MSAAVLDGNGSTVPVALWIAFLSKSLAGRATGSNCAGAGIRLSAVAVGVEVTTGGDSPNVSHKSAGRGPISVCMTLSPGFSIADRNRGVSLVSPVRSAGAPAADAPV
jgi:hypothetical protein